MHIRKTDVTPDIAKINRFSCSTQRKTLTCGSTGILNGKASGSCRIIFSNVGISAALSSSGLNTG